MSSRSSVFTAVLIGAALLFAAPAGAEEPIEFTAQSGESVAAFRGTFEVPENRDDPDSRMITLSYVRFPATGETAGPPVVYLSGGPGGSGTGTARAHRFPLFMAMRQHGDVVAFDQRGTGFSSNDLPECVSSVVLGDTEPVDDEDITRAYRAAAIECRAFWAAQGIDVRGYTTRESVRDLAALREHLGAERIALWGISYGSHLALAALDAIPEQISRVVMASVEGLDQTVKLPARTDAYFARLQAAVDSQPAAAARYPDIAGTMRRVHARLEAEPMLVTLPQADGGSADLLVQRPHAQMFASALIADPQSAAILLALYASLDQGDPSLLVGVLSAFGHTPDKPVTLRAMPTAMDLASGVSAQRLAQFEAQAPSGLVGHYLNLPMPQIHGVWEDIDLGAEFRDGPVADTPVLVLSGTLDGRTYLESQAEAVAGLSNATIVTVRNAGHNLFMSSPQVHDAIHRFMRGEPVATEEIVVDLPDFTQLPF